jgi:hypothetical protein
MNSSIDKDVQVFAPQYPEALDNLLLDLVISFVYFLDFPGFDKILPRRRQILQKVHDQ